MQTRRADFYQIPSIYDIIHARWTAYEFRGVERIAQRFLAAAGRKRQLWFEPACGTGRFLLLAARRGRDVVGIDSSEPMIAYARRRFERAGLARRAALTLGDMTSFDRSILPNRARGTAKSGGKQGGGRGPGGGAKGEGGEGGVDLAFNLINTVRHLPTDKAMLDHFACIASILRPGGVYIVGLGLARYHAEFPAEDVWQGARGRCRVRQVIQYTPPLTEAEVRRRREQVVSHITVTRPRGVEHIESSYWLRTYSPGQWDRVLARSALRTIAVTDEEGNPLVSEPSGYALWVLSHR